MNAEQFREGMSKVAAAVHIITVHTGAERLGTTATAVCSVSDSPPTLLVCLHQQGRVGAAIEPGTSLAVNTLGHQHTELAGVFAGKGAYAMDERFSHGRWAISGTEAPLLKDSVISFRTTVEKIVPAASHNIVLCRVHGLSVCDDADSAASPALVYAARNFQAVSLDCS